MNILEAIAKAAAESANEQKNKNCVPEEQVADLREFFAARATDHKFTPGQIMRHKTPKLAMIKWADQPHMFLEYLEEPISAVGFATTDSLSDTQSTVIYDCKIAVRTPSCVATFFSQSSMWEPHPDFTEAQMN